jgi:hypothetical protein
MTIKTGDRVKVEFEGEVTVIYKAVGEATLCVKPDDHEHVVLRLPAVYATKIDPPVKVGDEVMSKIAYDLPIGSVVLYEPGGGASLKITDKLWSTPSEGAFEPKWGSNTPLRVLHIGNKPVAKNVTNPIATCRCIDNHDKYCGI